MSYESLHGLSDSVTNGFFFPTVKKYMEQSLEKKVSISSFIT